MAEATFRGVPRWSSRDRLGISPLLMKHLDRLVVGKEAALGITWETYFLDKRLLPLLEKKKSEGLFFLSVGRGDGAVVEHLIRRGWPVGRVVGPNMMSNS